MSFFESEVVRAELAEVQELQKRSTLAYLNSPLWTRRKTASHRSPRETD